MNKNIFKLQNSPESQKSSLFCVVTDNVENKESGLFSVYDKRVPKKFWLKPEDLVLLEHEDMFLNNVKYKGKTFGKNKKAKRAAIVVISLMRRLCKNKKQEAHLSRDILGKLLKSNATADHVLNALIEGNILKHNGFSNRENKVARKWKFKLFALGEYLQSKGFKKRVTEATRTPLEANSDDFMDTQSANAPEELLKPFSGQTEAIQENKEFQIDFSEETEMIFEEITPTTLNKRMNDELNQHEEYQQKMIVKSLSPYFKKRFASFGLDIYGTSYCDCCNEMLPNALFSVSNSGILNRKCKMCYDIEEKSESSVDPLVVAREVGKFAKGLRKGYCYAR